MVPEVGLPDMGENDLAMFYRYLDMATIYFEYGAGGSTVQATKRDGIKKIYSVESSPEWHEEVSACLSKDSRVKCIYVDINNSPGIKWGYPGSSSIPEQWTGYSDQLSLLGKEESLKVDCLLIDGRFRVACCLKAMKVTSDDCIFIFDDFLNRPQYNVCLLYTSPSPRD